MNAIGYIRVSSKGQAVGGLGLEDQRRCIRQWAKANGYRVTICEDQAVAGTLPAAERPGFIEALRLLGTGQAKAFCIARLDRIARSLTVQESALALVWRSGAEVYTCDGGHVPRDDPDDPMRTAMRQVLGAFAQLDRAQTVGRLRRGRALKAERGGHSVGASPYGYTAIGGTLEPVESEQRALRRIRDLRASGASLRLIAATLETEGHPTKRGGRWAPQTVALIVARPDPGTGSD